jgi:hypothetical protein
VDEQHELFGGLVRRWLPKLSNSQASLSKIERATISNISLTIESIFNELTSTVDGKGKIDRSSLLWFLGSFCHLLAHTCFYHYDSLASSTFTRMGQYVTHIGGKVHRMLEICLQTLTPLDWLKEPRFRMKEVSNSKALKSATPHKMLDQRGDAQILKSPVKQGSQRVRVNAPSRRSDLKSKSCMYCHEDKLGPSGKPMKLYVCKCGEVFHHMCAGDAGNDDMTRCRECCNNEDE